MKILTVVLDLECSSVIQSSASTIITEFCRVTVTCIWQDSSCQLYSVWGWTGKRRKAGGWGVELATVGANHLGLSLYLHDLGREVWGTAKPVNENKRWLFGRNPGSLSFKGVSSIYPETRFMYIRGKNIKGSGMWLHFRRKLKIPNMALLVNIQYVSSCIQTYCEHVDEENVLFILCRSVPKFT